MEDLRIQTRTYDLLQWLLPKVERFPRIYRTTLTQRLLDAALDLNEAIGAAIAEQGRGRAARLREADAALTHLRTYLRLIFEWRWLSLGQYEHVSRIVSEIGRMLGAWLKQQSRSGD
jgi:hypothetical protein